MGRGRLPCHRREGSFCTWQPSAALLGDPWGLWSPPLTCVVFSIQGRSGWALCLQSRGLNFKDAQRQQNHLLTPAPPRGAGTEAPLRSWLGCIICLTLTAALPSVPRKCLLGAPNSASPRINQMPLMQQLWVWVFCGVCVFLSLRSPAVHSRCGRGAALAVFLAPSPPRGAPLFPLQKLPRALCRGWQTKADGFCSYAV